MGKNYRVKRPSGGGRSSPMGAAVLDEGDVTVRPSRLVRYPNTSNALRALLDDAGPTRMTMTYRAQAGHMLKPVQPNEKPFASERSKPSLTAMRLLKGSLAAGAELGERPFRAASPSSLPRVEPTEIFDGSSLGQIVRIRRQMLQLTQQQLADRAGVGRRFIGELESGKPTVELGKSVAVCHALGLSLTAAVADGG